MALIVHVHLIFLSICMIRFEIDKGEDELHLTQFIFLFKLWEIGNSQYYFIIYYHCPFLEAAVEYENLIVLLVLFHLHIEFGCVDLYV